MEEPILIKKFDRNMVQTGNGFPYLFLITCTL
jgi:hypothetical protein